MVVIHKKKIESEEEKEARKKEEQDRAMGLQDDYQVKGFELVTWVQENKGLVTGLIVLAFLAGGALSAYLYYQQRASEQASSAYLSAIKLIDGVPRNGEENLNKYKEAQTLLANISKEYNVKSVGTIADLYAGHLALQNRETQSAMEIYKKAADSLPKNHELKALALIGLGYAQEELGQSNEALASFAALADDKAALGRELALFEAARLSEKNNQKEKAINYASSLLDEYPASVYEVQAKRIKESL